MAKISKADIQRTNEARKRIAFYGTPEKGYLDSGLWEFLEYVYTKDEGGDEKQAVRKLLSDGAVYVYVVFLFMLACKSLLIPKSRQIRMSWILCAYCLWTAMRAPYRNVLFQSKDKESAERQTSLGGQDPGGGRIDFILQNLPPWLRDQNIVKGTGNGVGKMSFTPLPNDSLGEVPWQGSKIYAVAQGADKSRQYTLALFASDESAFQDQYRESIGAAGACLSSGGQSISVSSVYDGSHFNNSVLAMPRGDGRDPATDPSCWGDIPEAVKIGLKAIGLDDLPKGMRARKAPGDVWVLETHYSADPAKDPEIAGPDWVTMAANTSSYMGDLDGYMWQREMEIKYRAGGAVSVFPFLQPGSPIYCDAIRPDEAKKKLRFYAGYDYGSNNPSAFEVIGVDAKGVRYAVWELYEPCVNLKRHVESMRRCPYWDLIEYIVCDPSMSYKNQRDTASGELRTIIEHFQGEGVHMIPGTRGQDFAIAQRFLSDYWGEPDDPTFFITKSCPNLWKEVCGLKKKEHVSDAVKMRKNAPEGIMDKDNHAWDAVTVIEDYGMQPFAGRSDRRDADNTPHAVIRRSMSRTEPISAGVLVV